MNKHLILIVFTLCALSAEAQKEQICKVRELNSKRKPLDKVLVIFEDAPPAVSQSDGTVRLLFQSRKAGEWAFKLNINLAGYELVNEKELEKVKLSADSEFGVDIILARTGVVDSVKAIYYDVSNKSLNDGFAREKAKLLRQMDDMRYTSEQKAQALDSLQQLLDIQHEKLNDLSEWLACTNFDDVDMMYCQALELFKAGKIDKTISLLELLDPVGVIQKFIADESRDTDSEKNNAARSTDRMRIKPGLIASVHLLTGMYKLHFNPGKAEIIYDNLVRLAPTDLDILQEVANFYQENHHYDKAISSNQLVIAHPKAEDWQVANAYGNKGEMYLATGNLPAALEAHIEFNERYEKLCRSDAKNRFYKNNLAISYSRLGTTHTTLGNLPKALTFFEEETKLFGELHEAYPQKVDFKNGLAISYEKLGATHTALGNLSKALNFFEDAAKLFEELHETYPQKVDFKNGLAISYSKLGETHTALGNLPKALTFFEACNSIEKELHEAYPQKVDFKNGLVISYQRLGATHTALGNLPKALNFFEDETALSEELYKSYPQKVDFKSGLAISYAKLGDTHRALGNLPKALAYFEESNQLIKKLHEDYPQNADFKYGLAISYAKLGETHTTLGNLPRAVAFFEKEIELSKELHKDYPQNVSFKNGLAISYSKLGETHTALGNLPKALTFFEDETKLFEALHEAYPQNVSFKYGLAISYQYLGDTHTALGNLSKALTFFEAFNTLEKELYESYPENVDFKNGLAISNAKLGGIYVRNKDFVQAQKHYLEYEKMEFDLLSKDQSNVNFLNGVAIANAKLGMTYLGLNEIEKSKMCFQTSHQAFEILFNISPESAYFKANFYQSLAVSIVMRSIIGQELEINLLKEASEMFNEVANATQNSDYLKRRKIIEMMMNPEANVKDLIIEITTFTL
jgi:tetratricopeptide (TPR) repeat protein